MRQVLINEKFESKFQQEGFVTVDFLNEEEVEFLKDKFFSLLPESGGNLTPEDSGISQEITYDFTFIDKSIDFKRKVFKVITDVFDKRVQQLLLDYKPIIANFIRKGTDGGEVPLHQNWAFVDEKKCTSVSIWCPLVDSDEENGVLQVVPGSHKRYGEVRGPMVPWELEGIKNEIVENALVPCSIKAGQAVILDDSIVHYSAINKTDNLRLAIQLILIPEEEPSIHYHLNSQEASNKVKVLEVDREFYMQFNPWKKPENYKLLKEIDYQPFEMSFREFQKGIYGRRIDEPKQDWFSKLKEVFS